MGLFGKDRDLTQPLEQVELMVDASALGQRVEDVSIRLDAFSCASLIATPTLFLTWGLVFICSVILHLLPVMVL